MGERTEFDNDLDEFIYELRPRQAELLIQIIEAGEASRLELMEELRQLVADAFGESGGTE